MLRGKEERSRQRCPPCHAADLQFVRRERYEATHYSTRHGLRITASPELEHGSASLLRKCDGLPLALASVSDYLKSSSEPTGELCAKLCGSLGSHLKENHDHGSFFALTKVLHDSYDSLSGYALSCFLYLGVFPSNRPLKKKVVTRRWLAEGYAQSQCLRGKQDIADDNFDKKLVDCNIIRPIDTGNNAQVKTCKAHGIMHEFVLDKSMSQRFIMTTQSPADHHRPRTGGNNTARHLSVHDGKLLAAECVAASDEDLSRVRSLTVFGDAGGAITSYVRKLKLIRVMDLEECIDLKDNDLKHICRLWHLKYLSLGDTTSELPRCIGGLHCLETLDLRRTKIWSEVTKVHGGKLFRLPPFVTLLPGLTDLCISSATLTLDLLSALSNLGRLL